MRRWDLLRAARTASSIVVGREGLGSCKHESCRALLAFVLVSVFWKASTATLTGQTFVTDERRHLWGCAWSSTLCVLYSSSLLYAASAVFAEKQFFATSLYPSYCVIIAFRWNEKHAKQSISISLLPCFSLRTKRCSSASLSAFSFFEAFKQQETFIPDLRCGHPHAVV